MNDHLFTARWQYEPWLCRQERSPEELVRIGFFDDGLTPSQLVKVINDKRWVTPISHLALKGIVLVTTGAFSPFHEGHLRMLEIAKKELEAKGKTVAGAYVVPDHDGYVSSKRGGVCACDASIRIHLAQETTKHVDWIAVDPWAALYQDRPLNYTTILRRMERYLGHNYQVVYVFGSDNALFADAFLPHEYVCVGRPGYNEPHVDALDISSTKERSLSKRSYPAPGLGHPYVVRDDLDWATAPWGAQPRATTVFWGNLQVAICEAVGYAPSYVATEDQAQKLAELKQPYVSFDRITGAHHWVSRVFNPCTHQHKPARWLSSDLFSIPPGEYALVDDDIASGSTVEYIKWHTPQVKWTETISMTKWSIPSFFDIVDARDFLFGARLGGLCIQEDDKVYRAPYISPWVNLMQRAKIPPAKQQAFTKAIIEANVRFFESVEPVITVADTDNPNFWQRLGYSLDMSMRYVSLDLLSWNPN